MKSLFTELKRRNIFRVAGVYAVVGWILMQVVAVMTPALHLPDWVDSFFAVALIIGFPIAMLLAWAFEMTPEGVKRTEHVADGDSVSAKTGRKLDFAILGGLVLVGALVVGNRLLPQKTATLESAAPEIIVKEQADEKPSIAVMPFEDFSAGKDQEYFASGISEELLNVLARIDGLKVSSRTSSFAFKEREASTGEIAEALGVKHILEGSVRKSGTTLRITAQLIDTSNDEHMWSETYDRPLTAENLFAVQDEIAAAIVDKIKGKLSLAPEMAPERTGSLEAYELYLRARENMQKRQPGTLRAAVNGFKQVIALDPDFAPAFSGLADTYLLMPGYAGMDDQQSLDLARPNVNRALELAPNAAEALTSAAFLANIEEKFDEAIAFADQAIAANPNYADAHFRKGRALMSLGRQKKALAVLQQARALDPLSGVILLNIGGTQQTLGDRAGARKTFEDSIRWNPDSPFGALGLARLLLEEGDLAGAHSLFKDAQALNPKSNLRESLATIYIQLGMLERAEKIANKPQRAAIYSLRGMKEKALAVYAQEPDNDNLGYILYLNRAYAKTRPWAGVIYTKYKLQERPIDVSSMVFFPSIAKVFQHENDPRADVLLAKLNAKFETIDPAEAKFPSVLWTGAMLQVLNGHPKQAFVWIDRFLDLNLADFQFLRDPIFDSLRDTPEFAAREKRMNDNIAKQRAAIEAQLANPKPNWVK